MVVLRDVREEHRSWWVLQTSHFETCRAGRTWENFIRSASRHSANWITTGKQAFRYNTKLDERESGMISPSWKDCLRFATTTQASLIHIQHGLAICLPGHVSRSSTCKKAYNRRERCLTRWRRSSVFPILGAWRHCEKSGPIKEATSSQLTSLVLSVRFHEVSKGESFGHIWHIYAYIFYFVGYHRLSNGLTRHVYPCIHIHGTSWNKAPRALSTVSSCTSQTGTWMCAKLLRLLSHLVAHQGNLGPILIVLNVQPWNQG